MHHHNIIGSFLAPDEYLLVINHFPNRMHAALSYGTTISLQIVKSDG